MRKGEGGKIKKEREKKEVEGKGWGDGRRQD